MGFPQDLLYTTAHVWIRVENGVATVGITDHNQDQLEGTIRLDLPAVGRVVTQFEKMGVAESAGSFFELFSSVSGAVVEVNEELVAAPETINEDMYGEGWLIKIRLSDPDELESLLSAADYDSVVAEAEED